MFLCDDQWNFEHSQDFNFETDFLENENFFQKTKIEKASFPYKTAISEANVKTNTMVTTKWAYHRERSFTSNYFICFKSFVSVYEPLMNNDLMFQQPKRPNSYVF